MSMTFKNCSISLRLLLKKLLQENSYNRLRFKVSIDAVCLPT